MHTNELNYLNSVLDNVRKFLPIQAPLSGYIHNNVLQVLENKNFFEAIEEAHRIYDSNLTMPEKFYKEAYASGRISNVDLDYSLSEWMDTHQLEAKSYRFNNILKSLLMEPILFEQSYCEIDTPLQLFLNQKLKLPYALPLRPIRQKKSYRWKRFWLEQKHENFDVYVYPLLIKLLSTHLDQGLSFWPNPFSKESLWSTFTNFFSVSKSFLPIWAESIPDYLRKYENKSTAEILINELTLAGIPQQDWEDHLLDLSFDLRGWAGMVNKFETEPEIIPLKLSQAQLVDFFAIRFLLGHALHDYLCNKHKVKLSNKERLYFYYPQKMTYEISLKLWSNILKRNLISFEQLEEIPHDVFQKLTTSFYDFNQIDRSFIWHRAYEQNFVSHTLDSIYINAHTNHVMPVSPYAQVFFCIDDREESLRRHLEEIDSEVRTHGVVGFFGIDMNFVSIHHPRKVAQCPPVVKPSRLVVEIPHGSVTKTHSTINKQRSILGKIALSVFFNSRSLVGGQISSLVLGLFSFIPLSLRIYSPVKNKDFTKYLKNLFFPEIKTDFILDRSLNMSYENEVIGYDYKEMADKVELILKQAGVTKDFSPLMIMIGHGSSSVNNPFIAAYGCGACGGRPGAPNARAFAMIANKKEVRSILQERGIMIPDTTIFIGGYHNTCSDEVDFFDIDLIPESHIQNYNKIKYSIDSSLGANAQERTRRFGSVGMISSPKDALEYVRTRSENLAEPRPEYGHSTNGITIVGRRDLSKDLFLDRRAFLVSYDYLQDREGAVLLGILGAAIPVCAGINLDYFFSQLDNEKFGCGSKLPLNITSLLGVMTGATSDLRIGLPRQMVEIHEPIRNTFIVETTEDVIYRIMEKNPRVSNIIKNQWVFFSLIDPQTHEMKVYTSKGFVPFTPTKLSLQKISRSKVHFENQNKSLDFVQISKEERC